MSEEDFVESGGNVFADMELEDADELMIRAQLGHAVREILEGRKRKQREIAEGLDHRSAHPLYRNGLEVALPF